MELPDNAENTWMDCAKNLIHFAFELITFCFTELFAAIKTIFLSFFELISVFNISGPEDVVLWLLSISSVVFILSKLGWLPESIDRAINRNQRSEIGVALELLGIKKEQFRTKFRSIEYSTSHDNASVKSRATKIVDRSKLKKDVLVGQTHSAQQSSFVDLMGASTNPTSALRMAVLINSFIGTTLREDAALKNLPDFDYVATPKSGSPLIGYEFSKLVEKPLLLHTIEPKYTLANGNKDPLAHFDCNIVPEEGKTVLIVDDSSTGGRKVRKLVDDLKKLGLKVNYCVVIFEPQSKVKMKQNADSILKDKGIKLISIVESE